MTYRPRPTVFQAELTNHCPYTCLGCPRTEHMDRGLGMMRFDTFKRVIDEVRETQRSWRPMGLHHMGESLLHQEIDQFVSYATSRGVPTALSCRPNHLTPEKAESLIRAGLCAMIISFDGLDSPTLRRITGKVADYPGARDNVEHLLRIKRELGLLERDYVVLCHGWLQKGRAVTARLRKRPGALRTIRTDRISK